MYTLIFYVSKFCLFFFCEGVPYLALPFLVDSAGRPRNRCSFFLAFCWCIGFVCGIACYSLATESLYFLLRSCLNGPASILASLLTAALPILLTVVAISCFHPGILFVLAFLDAFLLSFVSFGIWHSFPSAGWLVSYLVLADRWLCTWGLYYLRLRFLRGTRLVGSWHSILALLLLLGIEGTYCCIVSPFLARLIIL